MFKEPGSPYHHVLFNGLHLEVGGNDGAHMKELMAMTYEVKAARCKTLRQMCGKQKAREESQGNVLVVKDVGVIVCTAFSYTQKHPVEQRNVIKQVWVGKGKNAEIFAELWTLAFRESLYDVMIMLPKW